MIYRINLISNELRFDNFILCKTVYSVLPLKILLTYLSKSKRTQQETYLKATAEISPKISMRTCTLWYQSQYFQKLIDCWFEKENSGQTAKTQCLISAFAFRKSRVSFSVYVVWIWQCITVCLQWLLICWLFYRILFGRNRCLIVKSSSLGV